ncbi:MAG TPA: transglutaminase-like cysteine peptidase [Candidatus Paceibacterota bacterium]|nr:transglutaminase-like cysteine peptidase [Candidatus Paceibacterota bacterium]
MRYAAFCAALCAGSIAFAEPSAQPFQKTYGDAVPFSGAIQFCDSYPQECVPQGTTERLVATKELFELLAGINRDVNKTIEGTVEREEWWSIPANGKGDCEDIAILKRHILIRLGLPSGALLLAVVRDEDQNGHALLIVRTTVGDFALDNKIMEVVPWHALPYRWLQRQSIHDPRLWRMLEAPVTASARK